MPSSKVDRNARAANLQRINKFGNGLKAIVQSPEAGPGDRGEAANMALEALARLNGPRDPLGPIRP